MTADIMGLLNINLVNLLNNRYDKLYKSDKNIYYTQKNRRITNYIVDKSYYFK